MGQVLFPSQALSQAQDLITAGLLFKNDATPTEKRDAIFDIVKSLFRTYPIERDRPFTIVFSTRSSQGMNAKFYVFILSWNMDGWKEEELPVPATSGIIKAWGSGEIVVNRWYKRWMNTRQGGRTSRSVFSAFCDALASAEDPMTGGAPQLVGLYREGGSVGFGVVYGVGRHILGVPLNDQALLNNVEWRNPLFERCNGKTMKLLEGAQRHMRPRGLGKAL
jgi:hypothetical protein